MTSWVLSYYAAAHLVWGVIRVGAPAYCPDQHDLTTGRSCYDAACDGVPAECTVARVDRAAHTVTLTRRSNP